MHRTRAVEADDHWATIGWRLQPVLQELALRESLSELYPAHPAEALAVSTESVQLRRQEPFELVAQRHRMRFLRRTNGAATARVDGRGALSSLVDGSGREWAGAKAKVLNDPEANKGLRREYRGEWEYPEV